MSGFGGELHAVAARFGMGGAVIDFKGLEAFLGASAYGAGQRTHECEDEGFIAEKRRVFQEVLKKELRRIEAFVGEKATTVIRRSDQALQSVESLGQAMDKAVVQSQLSCLYDDVVLLLWFIGINLSAILDLAEQYGHALRGNLMRDVRETQYLTTTWRSLTACRTRLQQCNRGVLTSANTNKSTKLLEKSIESLSVQLPDEPTAKKSGTIDNVNPTSRRPKRAAQAAHPQRPCTRPSTDKRLLKQYVLGQMVGYGAYGTVFSGTCKLTKEKVAVKTIAQPWELPVFAQRVYREIAILRRLHHPNVIPLLQVVVGSAHEVHLVFPFLPQTLEQLLINSLRTDNLQLVHKKFFIYELLKGLAYLHDERCVVHRDLKLSNILVNINAKPMRLYISDFGSARTLVDGATRDHMVDCPGYVQSQWYRAPEILLCGTEVTPAADMWSLGCVVGELMTGVPLLPGQDTQHQLELVLSCTGPPATRDVRDLRNPYASFLLQQAGVTLHESSSQGEGGEGSSSTGGGHTPQPGSAAGADDDDDSGMSHHRCATLLPRRDVRTLLKEISAVGPSCVERNSPRFELQGIIDRYSPRPLPSALSTSLDDDGIDLIEKCLVFAPGTRVSASTALHHPWLRSLFPSGQPPPPAREPSPLSLPLSCATLYLTEEYREGLVQTTASCDDVSAATTTTSGRGSTRAASGGAASARPQQQPIARKMSAQARRREAKATSGCGPDGCVVM